MAHEFHQTQMTYMLAKAAYETAAAEYNALCAPHMYLLDDDANTAAFDQYDAIADAAQEKTGIVAFRRLLREAEDALIEWARQRTANNPLYVAREAELNELYEAIKLPQHMSIRRQVIDLSARLK